MHTFIHSIPNVELLNSMALTKQNRNIDYLLEINVENLLFPYRYESGITGSVNYKKQELHGGWDSSTSHIRGTFAGHYLSAAAMLIKQQENPILRSKAEYIADQIRKCQLENGGQWAFPIPEKYIWQAKKGKNFWAPLYVCHKVMMGLLDMGKYLNHKTSFQILEGCTEWFVNFINQTDQEELSRMMNRQETGGIMELWADLYSVTEDKRHLTLMRSFERHELFDPVLVLHLARNRSDSTAYFAICHVVVSQRKNHSASLLRLAD